MEHEHEAAPVAPISTPDTASAPVAMPSLAGGLSPARILALQRTAGNAAVSALLQGGASGAPPSGALLQRDDKTPVAGPGDFGFTGGVPVGQGTTTVSGAGDTVTAKAPKVTMDGGAWVQDGKTLGGSAYLGIIQNLTHSDRVVEYRHGGDPAGEVVAEVHEAEENKWDSTIDPTTIGPGKEMKPQAFAPFYWPPGNLDDDASKSAPAKAFHTGDTPYDQPAFPAPVNHGAGRITAFKGQDVFKMGMAVKKDATVWMLTGTTWTVDWSAPVDASLNGAGKAVQTSAIQDLLKDGPNPALKDWSLAPGAGSAFEGFSSQAEAMKRTPEELLKWIFLARDHDPVSYKNICAALDAKNPSLVVDVVCGSTDRLIGSDVLSASIMRNGAIVKSESAIRLNNGDKHSLSVSWGDAFGSAAGLTPGTAIMVTLTVGGDGKEATATMPLPFTGSKEITPGSGKYGVTVSLA